MHIRKTVDNLGSEFIQEGHLEVRPIPVHLLSAHVTVGTFT